uniref:Solute carrier family 12 member 9 n=1 Tax=Acrobeloides nanus TaxID=290746 RepID=A0A914C2Q2_9BILA
MIVTYWTDPLKDKNLDYGYAIETPRSAYTTLIVAFFNRIAIASLLDIGAAISIVASRLAAALELMSSTTAETLNGTSGTTVAEKRPSKLRSYLESIGKSKIKPTDVELNATLSEDHGIPTLQKFVGYKNPLTIKELINYQEKYEKDDIEITHIQRKDSEDSHHTYSEGFGWVTGVLIRTILCIFGATLFLRMSWIAGQSGLLVGLCIVALGLVIVGITAISMSAIATNGEIRDGGFYYLISRTLGPEFGGSIGIIFYLATIGNAAMNLVGLSEAIVSILKDYNIQLIDGDINDNRVYSLVICLILQAIIFAGTKFEAKAPVQIVLILTIMVSLVSHFIGTFFPTDYQRGFKKRSLAHILYHNLWPDFRLNESFITVFGIYFPAMAGIMGGVNMAGDLKNPSKAIPKGTLPAIIITTFTYAMIMILTCATTVPDATGFDIPEVDTIHHRFIHPPCRWNNSCPFGQNNDYE